MANLEIYRKYVTEIQQYAVENGISAAEMNKIFEQCFRKLDLKLASKALVIKKPFRIFKYILSTIFGIFVCSIVLYNHPATHTFILRNMQNFIYPGLKVFRKFAVPIVNLYPSLTGILNYDYLRFLYVLGGACKNLRGYTWK